MSIVDAVLSADERDEPDKSLSAGDDSAAIGHGHGLDQFPPSEIDSLSRFPSERELNITEHPNDHATTNDPAHAATAAVVQTRMSKLTERDRAVAVAEAAVLRLEQRIAAAAAHLDQIGAAFEAQRSVIESGVTGVSRLVEIASTLEKLVVKLSEEARLIARPDANVEQLQQRAAETSAQLEQLARTKGEFERELARLQRHLQGLAGSAQHHAEEIAPALPPPKTIQVPWRLSAVVGGLVVAAAMTLALRSLVTQAHIPRALLAGPGQLARSTPPPVLPSRPLNLAVSSIDAPIRPMMTNVKHPSLSLPNQRTRLGRLEAVAAVAIRSDPARSARAAKIPMPERRSNATETNRVQVPDFTGALAVQSDPPGAAVFVDRKYVGQTPVRLTALRAGSHAVWVEREGHKRWTGSVLVPADKETRVSADLRPDRNR